MPKVDGLTDKQAKFVEEYLVDLNATQAAIRAGYSEDTARQTGYEPLSKPYIKAAIEQRRAELAKNTITPERIMLEYARIGMADHRKLFSDEWGILPPSELDDDTAAAITGVKVTKRRTGEQDESGNPLFEDVQEYKLADKKGALDSMAKHLGMFVEKTEDVTPTEKKQAEAQDLARAIAHVIQQGIKNGS